MLAGVHRGLGVQLRVVRNRCPMVPQVLPLSDHRPWLTPGWHLLVATNATRHSSRRPIGAGQTRPIVLAPATHQDSTVGLASCPVAPGEAWDRQAQLFRALAEDRDPLNPGRCVAFVCCCECVGSARSQGPTCSPLLRLARVVVTPLLAARAPPAQPGAAAWVVAWVAAWVVAWGSSTQEAWRSGPRRPRRPRKPPTTRMEASGHKVQGVPTARTSLAAPLLAPRQVGRGRNILVWRCLALVEDPAPRRVAHRHLEPASAATSRQPLPGIIVRALPHLGTSTTVRMRMLCVVPG